MPYSQQAWKDLQAGDKPAAAIAIPGRARTVFRRSCNVDCDGTPHEVLAIEHADGFLGFLGCCHFHKTKALGAASGAIFDQCNRGDGSGLTEVTLEFIFSGGVGQVSYI